MSAASAARVVFGLLCVWAGPALGQLTLSFVDVTNEPPPNGSSAALGHGVSAWTMDALIDVAEPDDWTVAGVCGGPLVPGIEVYYVLDPNTGDPVVTAPGDETDFQRFATFISLPREQFSRKRFGPSGVPSGPTFACHSPSPITEPGLLDLGWYEYPPTNPPDEGAILRITLVANGPDYQGATYFSDDGPTYPSDPLLAEFWVAAATDDVPSPLVERAIQFFGVAPVVSQTSFQLGEGMQRDFTVFLPRPPEKELTVTISGDQHVEIVHGAVLTFGPQDYDQPQPVTFTALEDADSADHWASLFLEAPGLAPLRLRARILDDDRIRVSPNQLTIPEGSESVFEVTLRGDPDGPVQIEVVAEGDPDIQVIAGGLLRFDSSDFDVPQPVTVRAAHDRDITDGAATIRVQSEGFRSASVDVRSLDRDEPAALFVDAGAAGEGNGRDWANAYTQLRDALAAADGNPSVREIRVATGVYAPAPPGGSRAASFRLRNQRALLGGFAGAANPSNPHERDPARYVTVLSGDLNGDDEPGFENITDNSRHVLRAAADVDASARIDGFAIRGGAADGDDDGGGLWCAGSPTVSRCRFLGNRTSNHGGAVYIEQGGPTFANCEFTGNEASLETGGGGGVWIEQSAAPTFLNCLFAGNTARNVGALRTGPSATAVIHCAISENRALEDVGGVRVGIAGATLAGCVIWGNTDAGGATQAAQLRSLAATPDLSINYSCVQGWDGTFGGVGNIGDDPRFVDPNQGDFHLAADSPCIDAGDPQGVVAPGGEADLDGQYRVWNGRADMGADEFAAPPLLAGDLDLDCDVDLDDLAALLAGFGAAGGAFHSQGDTDWDADVDLSDLARVLADLGAVCP